MSKKKYLKSIFNGLRCDKKVKDDLYREYSDMIDEKISAGMTMKQIVDELGEKDILRKKIVERLKQDGLLISRGFFIISKVLSVIQFLCICSFTIIVLYSFQQWKKFNQFISVNEGADTFIYGYSYNIQIVFISIVILFIATSIIKYLIKKKSKSRRINM